MTPRQCRAEVHRLIALLLEQEIALTANTPLLQQRGREITVASPISPAGEDAEGAVLRFPAFASVEEYLAFLRDRDYTCVLMDGSLLQVSFTFHRQEVVKHRLGFYPAPVELQEGEISPEAAVDEVIESLIRTELQELVESGFRRKGPSRLRLRSPLRFDFHPAAARPDHSACHLHLSHTECRWPVSGPLSLGHFVRFVFRRFFPDIWTRQADLRRWALRYGPSTLQPDEHRELHIASSR